jgi:hypothetical protein
MNVCRHPKSVTILVPRLFSFPFSKEKKTLVGAGRVARRIWEVKKMYFRGGETKARVCVFPV